ncbi:MAG TPA: PqqD family protein [Acidimicrobiales bacterium]|nr:PqqD family protein [Acidimicrobiales bacterium]
MKLKEPDVVWREVGDEIVILDTRSSEYLSLNDSGAVLWARLSDGATEQDLRQELVSKFGIDEDLAERDVNEFLASLRRLDMLDDGA